jgi:lipopolysaccharide cholinephosphotransferase
MNNRTFNEDPFGFSPLWDSILDMYEEFSHVCSKHNLRHYVIGGTLLGAVRHHGFIPWDDDFDIAMPRQDYEKFREVFSSEMPGWCKIVDRKNCDEFSTLFLKVQDSRKEKIAGLERKLNFTLSNGVFLDIFPIDGYPTGRLSLVCWNIRSGWLWLEARYSVFKRRPGTVIGYLCYWVGAFLHVIFHRVKSMKTFLDMREKEYRKYYFSDDKRSGMAGCHTNIYQMTFRERVFGDPVLLEFNGTKVNAPVDYNEFLRVNFGEEYMTLPPKNKQVPKHSDARDRAWKFGPTK